MRFSKTHRDNSVNCFASFFTATSVQEVRDLFAEHVNVRYVNLPKNQETGKIKGFAFVDVGTDEEIPKAVSALDGIELEGRPLRISRSLPKSKIRSTKKTCRFHN